MKQVGRRVAMRSLSSMRTRATCIFVRSANSSGARLNVENINASVALATPAANVRRSASRTRSRSASVETTSKASRAGMKPSTQPVTYRAR